DGTVQCTEAVLGKEVATAFIAGQLKGQDSGRDGTAIGEPCTAANCNGNGRKQIRPHRLRVFAQGAGDGELMNVDRLHDLQLRAVTPVPQPAGEPRRDGASG